MIMIIIIIVIIKIIITIIIVGPKEARNPNLDSDQRIADYASAPRL